jgi:hypothetical protein
LDLQFDKKEAAAKADAESLPSVSCVCMSVCVWLSLSLSLSLFSLGFFFSGAFVEKIPAADFHQSLSPQEHHLPVVLEDSFRSLQCILIRVFSP